MNMMITLAERAGWREEDGEVIHTLCVNTIASLYEEVV